jgi:hypothetical protein
MVQKSIFLVSPAARRLGGNQDFMSFPTLFMDPESPALPILKGIFNLYSDNSTIVRESINHHADDCPISGGWLR